jgi:gas vesicle protein
MRRLISFFIGTVSGALMGAALAILFAPSSGREFRNEIRSRVDRFRDEIQDAAQQRRVDLERQLQALRHPEIPLEDR